jgi:hypothetical protein
MDDAQLQKQGFDASLVKNVRRMVQRNEFKRLPSVIAKVHPTK